MTLQGRCEGCGEIFNARCLSLAFRPVGARDQGGRFSNRPGVSLFALLCGPCLAELLNPSGAESETTGPSDRRDDPNRHLGATTERRAS